MDVSKVLLHDLLKIIVVVLIYTEKENETFGPVSTMCCF